MMFESDMKSLEQVITKARHVVNDGRTLTGPGNRRSFVSDAWTMYDKVCLCIVYFQIMIVYLVNICVLSM